MASFCLLGSIILKCCCFSTQWRTWKMRTKWETLPKKDQIGWFNIFPTVRSGYRKWKLCPFWIFIVIPLTWMIQIYILPFSRSQTCFLLCIRINNSKFSQCRNNPTWINWNIGFKDFQRLVFMFYSLSLLFYFYIFTIWNFIFYIKSQNKN